MNKENQAKIIELVKQAKPLILQEMAHEKVTEKGVADYVTNVDVAVQNYLKRGWIGSIIYSICGYLKTMNCIKSGFPNRMGN